MTLAMNQGEMLLIVNKVGIDENSIRINPSDIVSVEGQVSIPCMKSGACCIDTRVPFFPYDLWKICRSAIGRKLGLSDSFSLFDKNIIEIKWNGFIPYAFTVPVDYKGIKICPFATDENGNTAFGGNFSIKDEDLNVLKNSMTMPSFWTKRENPLFNCPLFPVTPLACSLYPLSAALKLSGGDDPTLYWVFYNTRRNVCSRCYGPMLKERKTISEYIKSMSGFDEKGGVYESLQYTSKTMALIKKIFMFGRSTKNNIRFKKNVVETILFNSDKPLEYGHLAGYGTLNRGKYEDQRPKSFDDLLRIFNHVSSMQG